MALTLSARPVRDRPSVLPAEDPRWSLRGNELSGQYSAAAGDASDAASLLSKAAKHLEEEEHAEAEKVGREALEMFSAKNDGKGVADATRVICKALCFNEQRPEATAMAKAQLQKFEASGDKSGQAKMLLSLAEVNQDKQGSKQPENALKPAVQAASLFKELKETKMQALALLAQSFIHLMQSTRKDKVTELDSATARAKEALDLSVEIGDSTLEAEAYHAQAVAYSLQQDMEQCLQMAQKALDLFQDIGSRKAEAFETNCMAIWYIEDDKPQQALPAALDALELYQDIGGGLGKEVWAMSSVIRAYMLRREYGKAQKMAKKGATRFREEEDTYSEAYAKCLLMMAQTPDAVDTSIAAGTEALELFRSMKASSNKLKKSCMAQVLAALSELNLRASKKDLAVEQAEEAMRTYSELGDDEERAATLFALIEARMARGDVQDALVDAQNAQEEFQQKGAPREEANAWLAVCQCYSQKKDYTQALVAVKQADAIYQNEMDNRASAHCQTVMYDLYGNESDWDKAQKAAEKARRLWKSEGMKEAEANAYTYQVQSQVAATRRKEDKGGRSSAQSSKGWDKVLKAAKDQLANARKIEKDPGFAANGLRVLALTYFYMAKYDDSLNTGNEAISIYRETGDEQGEALALLICAAAYIGMSEYTKARDDASEATAIFEAYNDEKGKDEAQEILAVVGKVMAERQAQMASLQMPQVLQQMPQMMAAAAPEAGGSADAAGAVAARSRPAGGALDLSSGVSAEAVAKTISNLAMSIIGEDEAIEVDTPLMQAGLTSNTAVLLRDELSKDLPGVTLPPTLIFDYPSIQAIADFVVERANR